MVTPLISRVAQPVVASQTGRWSVTHVTATFPPYPGGTGTVVYHNARELARRGHDVRVVTATSSVGEHHDHDVPVTHVPTSFRVGNAPLAPRLGQVLSGSEIV